ncbi:hypothetical protein N1851_018727 [Merluccius polli]|uniref:Uncharacterized protein n=1 Tax=Merluccius polli TaxID=89951 RepID=A0AA47MMJ0_MERPO|nr:hypothetical protein N1851_018727 [Merluccius polli]
MDDLTITTSVPGSRWILQGLERLITWATMSFKPSKSRSMVLKKGKKSNKELGAWLTKVDKSGLPGRFKAWIYQHSILPQVLWPLLVYAVPMTTVESLERKISGFLRKWLGLPRSLITVWDDCPSVASLKNSWEEALQYRDSRDCKVSSAGVEEGSGRLGKHWRRQSHLRLKALVGTVATGRVGLGYFPKTLVSQAHDKERHHLLQEEAWSRHGGRASEQGSGTPAAGSVNKVGECTAAQDHLDKHLGGRARHLPAFFALEEAL